MPFNQAAKLIQQTLLWLGITICFAIQNADHAKRISIRTKDRKSEIGDHTRLDVGMISPAHIGRSVGDQQASAARKNRFAIEAGVNQAFSLSRMVGIAGGLTCDQNLNLSVYHTQDESGWNSNNLGRGVDETLPIDQSILVDNWSRFYA